jgi:plastocyanin
VGWHDGAMRSTQRAGACLALLLSLFALALPVSPARAATVTVTLTVQGPGPNPASAAAGDTVVFANSDAVTHTVKAYGSNWAFDVRIAAGSSASHVFAAGGSYGYTDTHAVGLFNSRSDVGTVAVSAPATKPTPAPVRTAAPSPAPRAPAKPPAASASPATSASPAAPGAGTALAPGLGSLTLPTAGPVPSAGLPAPDLAAPPPETALAQPTPQSTVGAVYADKGLTQGSPHRYGLPAVLAVLAVTGVASLLARLLLSEPAARRRRTRPGGAAD